MASLITLDTVKTKMEATSEALQEADNWTTLSTDVEESFRAQDVQKTANILLGMQRSLLILSDVSDHAQRQHRLVEFEARFEVLIAPKLQQAIKSRSENAKEYATICADIGCRSLLFSV